MAINFPSPALHGNTYEYQGILYTFDDGNAGGGASPGGGWWTIGTKGSYGPATGADIDLGIDSIKYVTPFAIAESLMVREADTGVTSLTYNGAVVATTTVGGLNVPGTLTTQNLSLLGNLTIPGILFSGGVETETTVIVESAGVDDTGISGQNASGGFDLYTDLSGALKLTSKNTLGANHQQVLSYARGGSASLAYNGVGKLTTLSTGVHVSGELVATGNVSCDSLAIAGALSAGGLILDTASTVACTAELKTTDGEVKVTADSGNFSISSSGVGGANTKTIIDSVAGSTSLYYDGAKKLNTASGGVAVTGNLATGTLSGTGDASLNSGTGSAAFVSYGNAGGGWIGNSYGAFQIGTCSFGGSSRQVAITATPSAETELYYNGQSKLETTSTGIRLGNGLFMGTDGSIINADSSFILSVGGDVRTTNAIHNDNASLTQDGTVISHSGQVHAIAESNVDGRLLIGNTIGRGSVSCAASTGLVRLAKLNAAGQTVHSGISLADDDQLRLYYGSANLRLSCTSTGGIQNGVWTNPAISDPSVKENITPRSGIDNILALNGVDWDWIDPDKHSDAAATSGFLADNYQDVYPEQVQVQECPIKEFIRENQHLLFGEGAITLAELEDAAKEACGVEEQNVGKLHIINNVSNKTFDADVVESIKFLYEEIQQLKARNDELEDFVANL